MCADFGINASTEISAPEQDITREKAKRALMAIRNKAAKDFPQGIQLDEIIEEIRKARYGEGEVK